MSVLANRDEARDLWERIPRHARAPAVPLAPALPDVVPPRRPDPAWAVACPELQCLDGILSDDTLAWCARRAVAIGVEADHVLVANGIMDEAGYVAALARWLSVAVESLNNRQRRECPFDDSRLIEASRTGLLPLRTDLGHVNVVVPWLAGARRLARMRGAGAEFSARVRLSTRSDLQRFVTSRAAAPIAQQAAHGLAMLWPAMSAARVRLPFWRLATVLALGAAATLLQPAMIVPIIEVVLGVIFLAWCGLRVLSMLSTPAPERADTSTADRDLPIYTVIVALHREAAAVASLVQALAALDYPREKLDIKLVLEPDDEETIAATRALGLRAPFEVVIAPAAGPRTKPKALNAALLFARGRYVAVFDAEDRPEPNQLRIALGGFARGDERLACVQARLTIDNTADSWITRLFTAEYAGLFDVMLPGLSIWRLPLPLGGSSNHFSTRILRDIGAWDAFNVTEDADLGMRLTRWGYTTAIINSTTHEEAPAMLRPWLRQRTRWFKGWMQTWLVHMRSPWRLWREFGAASFLSFQLIVGGTVLASLVHSIFVGLLLFDLALGRLQAIPPLYLAVLLMGYVVSGALAAVGLAQRGLLRMSWVLLLMPVYWLLLSAAAWRALHQLARDPFTWEKTEHGLAKTSRLAMQQAVIRRNSSLRTSSR